MSNEMHDLTSDKGIKPDDWHKNLWHPFTQITTNSPPQRILQGKGALLMQEEGPPLIDAISSWWVTLHGHAEPSIAKAIAAQANELEQVIFADFTHPQAERLAERLSLITGLQRLFFSDNGSTAVEVALKIAYQWWQNKGEKRQQIIAFDGAYHGDTFGAMAVGERNIFNAPFEEMMFPVSRLPWPATWMEDEEVFHREEIVLKNLDQLLEKPTAAIILEPLLQGAGGMRMVRKEFLQEIQIRSRKAHSLLIADEVLTGFGRCGSMFAYQRAGLKPDLIALSKGLTGGFLPMGVTMATDELFKGFVSSNPSHTFWHGHSFTANPLGCAAANASLDLLEKKQDSFTCFESRHLPYLEEIAKHPKVIRPRVKGTIAAFDLNVTGPKGYLNQAGKTIKLAALKHGVFLRPLGQVVYLLPPLCISNAQLEQCYFAISQGLKILED